MKNRRVSFLSVFFLFFASVTYAEFSPPHTASSGPEGPLVEEDGQVVQIIVKFKQQPKESTISSMMAKKGITEFSMKRAFPDRPKPSEVLKEMRSKLRVRTQEQQLLEHSLLQSADPLQRDKNVTRGQAVKREIEQLQGRIAAQKKLVKKLALRQKRASRQIDAKLNQIYVIEVPRAEVKALLVQLRATPNVEYVEQDQPVYNDVIPNDPLWDSPVNPERNKLYGLENINAPAAWDITTGRLDVIIAPMESGIDIDHEDLADNIWVNPGETADNGIDDDMNGYVDDINGVIFTGGTNYSTTIPSNSHGTHVAGTVAAKGDNNIGVVGVSWNSTIMPSLSTSALSRANAIYYATNNGADIITNSWYGIYFNNTIQDAINYAYSQGVVITTSAGNRATEAISQLPARYQNTITVAAADHLDAKAHFSNYGVKIDVTAPGTSIFSTTPNDNYGAKSGTSMSTPHVAGLVALILSYNLDQHESDPATYPLLTNEEVRQILRKSSDDIVDALGTGDEFPGFDIYSGYGRINALEALQQGLVCEANILSPTANLLIENEDFPQINEIYYNGWTVVSGMIDIEGIAQCDNFSHYTIEYGAGTSPSSWVEFANHAAAVSGTAEDNKLHLDFDTDTLSNGTYTVRLTVYDTSGDTFEDRLQVNIARALITNIPNGSEDLSKEKVFLFEPYDIQGLAYGPGFTSYHLEYGVGEEPTEWIRVSDDVLTPVEPPAEPGSGEGVLFEDFDFAQLPDGPISLKLVVSDAILGDSEYILFFDNDGSNFPSQQGFPVADGVDYFSAYSSPVTADLDGDGDKEIIIDTGATIKIYNHLGEELHSMIAGAMYGAVAVGNIVGDDNLEIAVKSFVYNWGGVGYSQTISVFHHDGTPVVSWTPLTFQIDFIWENDRIRSHSSPVVHDIDGDGYDDVIFGAAENDGGSVHVYGGDGQPLPGWEGGKQVDGQVNLTPAVGNIDNIGGSEIIVRDYTNKTYVFDTTGNLLWSQLEPTSYAWNRDTVLGDLNNDGTLEIISSVLGGIMVRDHTGQELWQHIAPAGSPSAISLADFNQDNFLDILIPIRDFSGQTIYIYNGDGTLQDSWFSVSDNPRSRGPVVGDVDGDGEVEIIIPGNKESKSIYGFEKDGTPLPEPFWPVRKSRTTLGTAVIDDLDGDGDIELVHRGGKAPLRVWDLPSPYHADKMPWPMYQQNAGNTGVAPAIDIPLNPDDITIQNIFAGPSATHVCIVASSVQVPEGGVLCAGTYGGWVYSSNNNPGTYGYGTSDQISTMVEAIQTQTPIVFPSPVVGMGLSYQHNIFLTADGSVWTSGSSSSGKLGYANLENIGDDERVSDVTPVDLGGSAIQVTAGFEHSCALLNDGTVRCWGDSYWGQLGYGNHEDIGDNEHPSSAGPVQLGENGVSVTKIATGADHTCALLENGNLYCWGRNHLGQLGYGNTEAVGDNELPADVGPVPFGQPVVDIVTGQHHTCALLQGGIFRCWGEATNGKLGLGDVDPANPDHIGDNEAVTSVAAVAIDGTSITQFSAGANSTSVLFNNLQVLNWGVDTALGIGLYGSGSSGDPTSLAYVDLENEPVSKLVETAYNTCVLLENGNALCWGRSSDLLGPENIGDGFYPYNLIQSDNE